MDSESRSLSVFSVIFSEQSVIKQALGEDEKKKKKIGQRSEPSADRSSPPFFLPRPLSDKSARVFFFFYLPINCTNREAVHKLLLAWRGDFKLTVHASLSPENTTI